MRAWLEREAPPATIPWTPIGKPLGEARVALISTAAVSRLDDTPIDPEVERRDPWRGDHTYRRLPRGTTTGDIRVGHLHINPEPGERDMNCLLPLDRLEELAEAGAIGDPAPRHYSFMGYHLDHQGRCSKRRRRAWRRTCWPTRSTWPCWFPCDRSAAGPWDWYRACWRRPALATAVHSWLPEYSTGLGAPRVVGIQYPAALPFGPPDDAGGPAASACGASLEAAAEIETPGQRKDLDFEWPTGERIPKVRESPPIVKLIKRKPWLYLDLLRGRIPGPAPLTRSGHMVEGTRSTPRRRPCCNSSQRNQGIHLLAKTAAMAADRRAANRGEDWHEDVLDERRRLVRRRGFRCGA